MNFAYSALLHLGELDSYMYQTAGHEVIEGVAQALNLPLYRRALTGTSLNLNENYAGPHEGDEVEDLYELLREVKVRWAWLGLDIQGQD